MRTVMIAVVMMAAMAAGVCAQQAPTAEVRGIRVCGPAYGGDEDGWGGLRPFNWDKGTTLALFLSRPEGGIIEVGETKITAMVDDKGTNLLGDIDDFFMTGMEDISDDAKACMLEIKGNNLPAKGATQISAAGTVALKCGTKQAIAKQANVALKTGTKVTAGPVPFTISKTGKPEMMFGDDDNKDAFEVTLKATQDTSNIAEIKFLDAAGKDLEAKGGFSSSMTSGNNVTVEYAYVLPKMLPVATIEVTYWEDLKEIQVPFAVTATLGL